MQLPWLSLRGTKQSQNKMAKKYIFLKDYNADNAHDAPTAADIVRKTFTKGTIVDGDPYSDRAVVILSDGTAPSSAGISMDDLKAGKLTLAQFKTILNGRGLFPIPLVFNKQIQTTTSTSVPAGQIAPVKYETQLVDAGIIEEYKGGTAPQGGALGFNKPLISLPAHGTMSGALFGGVVGIGIALIFDKSILKYGIGGALVFGAVGFYLGKKNANGMTGIIRTGNDGRITWFIKDGKYYKRNYNIQCAVAPCPEFQDEEITQDQYAT